MTYAEFINESVMKLSIEKFDSLKRTLFTFDLIPFSIIKEEDLTMEILAEKLCDYLEKADISNWGSFETLLKKYIENLNSIVEQRIIKENIHKENKKSVRVPTRAGKYLNRISDSRREKEALSFSTIIDISRIAFCLYNAIIDNEFKPVENFDFTVSSLDIEKLLAAYMEEKAGKKLLYEGPYSIGKTSLVLMIITYYSIIDNAIGDE